MSFVVVQSTALEVDDLVLSSLCFDDLVSATSQSPPWGDDPGFVACLKMLLSMFWSYFR